MHKLTRSALIALSLAVAFFPEYAQAQEGPGYWHDDWGWGHMFFGSIMMVLVWGGLILVILLAVRGLGGGPAKSSPRKTSLEILEERFARGEIDKEDFEERKRLLSD